MSYVVLLCCGVLGYEHTFFSSGARADIYEGILFSFLCFIIVYKGLDLGGIVV